MNQQWLSRWGWAEAPTAGFAIAQNVALQDAESDNRIGDIHPWTGEKYL
jgi:hypothetical protein